MFRIALIIAFSAVLAAEAGQVYKWVDEDGNVHYSDQPPLQEHDAEELKLESSPIGDDAHEAQERTDRLKAKHQTSRDQRSEVRGQKQMQRELEQAQQVYRKLRCTRARQDIGPLTTQLPVYSSDEKGNRVYLDDEERAAEIDRTRADINKFCD